MSDSDDPTSEAARDARLDTLREIRLGNVITQLSRPDTSQEDLERDISDLLEDVADGTADVPTVAHSLNEHRNNRDETWYSADEHYYGAYSKGLQHVDGDGEANGEAIGDGLPGEVVPESYERLRETLDQRGGGEFETIDDIEAGRPLVNPEASVSYNVYALDSNDVWAPPPPPFSSDTTGAELIELYWMAVLRDVPFADYEDHSLAPDAAREIAEAYTDAVGTARDEGTLDDAQLRLFGDPYEEAITSDRLFRGTAHRVADGPYVSQFLLKDFPRGVRTLPNTQRPLEPETDYLTDFEEWLDVQNGGLPNGRRAPQVPPKRHIATGRDLATFVRSNNSPQQFLNAAFYLQGLDRDDRKLDPGVPVSDDVDDGFVDFGRSAYQAAIAGIHNTHLRVAWYHKWRVHRRPRPEAYGGRIRNVLESESNGDRAAAEAYEMPDNLHLTDDEALPKGLQEVQEEIDTRLLPQAYAVGSPTHPSYPAGHGASAGTLATLLKAFFNEKFEIPNPVRPVMGPGGETELVDASSTFDEHPTVESEANKLAANTHLGRNFAGIHYRSDGLAGLELGERVATSYLLELLTCKADAYDCDRFEFTRFDGETTVCVTEDGVTDGTGSQPFTPPLYESRDRA